MSYSERSNADEIFLRDQVLHSFTEKELLCELIRRVFSIGGPIQHRGTLAKRGLEDLSVAFGCPEIMGIEVNWPEDRSIFDNGPFPSATNENL